MREYYSQNRSSIQYEFIIESYELHTINLKILNLDSPINKYTDAWVVELLSIFHSISGFESIHVQRDAHLKQN